MDFEIKIIGELQPATKCVICTVWAKLSDQWWHAEHQDKALQRSCIPADLLTSTVPTTPALATLCAILSVDEEVIIGFPRPIVAGFTVLKQTAAL